MDAVDQGLTLARLVEGVNLFLPLVVPVPVAIAGLAGGVSLLAAWLRRAREVAA